MNVHNLNEAKGWFHVVQTGEHLQTAVMTLAPGRSSSATKGSDHPRSVQILLVLEGEVDAEVGHETKTLYTDDCVILPPGVPHLFTNRSDSPARTFNVYHPPAY